MITRRRFLVGAGATAIGALAAWRTFLWPPSEKPIGGIPATNVPSPSPS
ncbi:MAG: twin-arginine translocation signal domain-containing protein, partial [Candidatus Limnocylindrales bacterium]